MMNFAQVVTPAAEANLRAMLEIIKFASNPDAVTKALDEIREQRAASDDAAALAISEGAKAAATRDELVGKAEALAADEARIAAAQAALTEAEAAAAVRADEREQKAAAYEAQAAEQWRRISEGRQQLDAEKAGINAAKTLNDETRADLERQAAELAAGREELAVAQLALDGRLAALKALTN